MTHGVPSYCFKLNVQKEKIDEGEFNGPAPPNL